MFSNRHDRIIEWGDCDAAGIVFYPRYFSMFDVASAALLETASGRSRAQLMSDFDVVSWPMVDTRAVFRATASFDDCVHIDSTIKRLGTSSFDVAHQLWRGAV